MKLKENALVFLTNLVAEEFVAENIGNEIKVTWTYDNFFIVDTWNNKIHVDKECFVSDKVEIPVRIVEEEQEQEVFEEEEEEEKRSFFKQIIIWWIIILGILGIVFYNQHLIKQQNEVQKIKEEIKILDKYESYTLLDNDLDLEIDKTLKKQEELKKQLQENYKIIKELTIQKENILKAKINLTNEN